MKQSTSTLFARARRNRYVDDLMEDYVSWRERCADVAATYERWRVAGREDEAVAFGAYDAALAREEDAARVYQSTIARFPGQ
jgi:hypothetical protein